jgi:hypothetical protein
MKIEEIRKKWRYKCSSIYMNKQCDCQRCTILFLLDQIEELESLVKYLEEGNILKVQKEAEDIINFDGWGKTERAVKLVEKLARRNNEQGKK